MTDATMGQNFQIFYFKSLYFKYWYFWLNSIMEIYVVLHFVIILMFYSRFWPLFDRFRLSHLNYFEISSLLFLCLFSSFQRFYPFIFHQILLSFVHSLWNSCFLNFHSLFQFFQCFLNFLIFSQFWSKSSFSTYTPYKFLTYTTHIFYCVYPAYTPTYV